MKQLKLMLLNIILFNSIVVRFVNNFKLRNNALALFFEYKGIVNSTKTLRINYFT